MGEGYVTIFPGALVGAVRVRMRRVVVVLRWL